MKYYIVYVGDDPGDENCRGPFKSFSDAVRNMSDTEIQYSVSDRPVDWVGPDIRGWHHALSSLYVVGHIGDDKPIWEKDILPVLRKAHSDEIKRQYDEE